MLENRQNPIILGESMRSRSIRSQSIPGNTEEDEEEDGVGFRASSSQSSLMNGYFGSKKPEKPQAALVIDGKTLAFALEQNLEQDFLRLANHCNSVLCCRATPFQKVRSVVEGDITLKFFYVQARLKEINQLNLTFLFFSLS